ncbi:uncharacterized protein LOC128216410 [Mya arenaria]|uniref:uncharacterized protein LOC128216410 n=1 Tax=Mya arenaria TaxID=6604 RepID=UPI0022E0C2C3|nr:uncharacterized protein LOC128216410 [Mya arenaria]
MNVTGVLLCLACLASVVQGYCYIGAPDPSLGSQCALANGTLIDIGTQVTYPDKCERCSCYGYHGETGGAALSCCGYGIHAGVFAPPPGCEIDTEEDGCTVKIVCP